ncbi:YkvA family protein [Inediibacterium massiliense]|uniref:YkvA family protein n=1 Tax=Inediibacterium massiliense TaxID=1658111 RepID=UPI0006B69F0B|nr:YkvA family protein [Inediibacterium massiliense]
MKLFKKSIKVFKKTKGIYKFIKDPEVSKWKKIMIFGAIVYVISPIDLIPDPVFGLGWIDDGIVIGYIISRISNELDKYIEKDSVSFKKGKIIEDVDYRIDDEK